MKHYGKKIEFQHIKKEFKEKTYGIQPNTKIWCIGDYALLPVTGVKRMNPLNFSQNICDYTKEGRKKIHENLKYINSDEFISLNSFFIC